MLLLDGGKYIILFLFIETNKKHRVLKDFFLRYDAFE